jgi:hypothetical protein
MKLLCCSLFTLHIFLLASLYLALAVLPPSSVTMTSKQLDQSPHASPLQASTKTPFAFGSKTGRSKLEGNFQPSNYSVIFSRGQESFKHVGNLRFRILTSSFIESYSQVGTSKKEKSAIVSNIVGMIRQAGGNFCRYEKGAWFEVGDPCAREKVGSCLRDLLCTKYSSSAKAKLAHRKARRLEEELQNEQQLVQSTCLRNMQYTQYQVSAKARLAELRARKLDKKQNQQYGPQLVQDTEHSDDSSTVSSSSSLSSCWGRDSLVGDYLPDDVYFDKGFIF